MASSKRHQNSRYEPTSDEQKLASEEIRENDFVFLFGESGTGKTFCAAGCGIQWLHSNKSGRIFVIRPAIGAGEQNGYLPGTIEEKVEPFLKPIFAALSEFENCDDEVKANVQRNSLVNVLTFEHLRGWTFENCYVIAEEVQNTTPQQMKLLLSRLGNNAKLVCTGDTDQSDLHGENGLAYAIRKLRPHSVPRMSFVEFTAQVSNRRHPSIPTILGLLKKGTENGSGFTGADTSENADFDYWRSDDRSLCVQNW